MNWPFENNTASIVRKLTKRSLQSEKRRNRMVITAVALAAFLISFGGGLMVSLLQMQNNQVADTYEAVFNHITEQDIETMKEQPGIARAGEYYLIGEELSARGFKGTFLYADDAMLYTGRHQMSLTDGKLPERANEIIVSKSWLKKFEPDAIIGDSVSLETDSFRDEYRITGIMDSAAAEGTDTYSFIISKEQLVQYADYSSQGYRAYVHLKNDTTMSVDEIKDYFEQLAVKHGLPSPVYHSQYLSLAASNPGLSMVTSIGLIAVVVLAGGCVVIQSIFRISIIDKIQSFGQLRTLGATKKQISRMVRKEGRQLGWFGILLGTILGIIVPAFLVPDGLNLSGNLAVMFGTAFICRGMVGISIRKPVKMAANVSPIEAVRFVSEQKNLAQRGRIRRNLNPFTLGKMNFNRDRKKSASIIVSLSIGGVLLLCASTLLLTYSPDTISRRYFPNGDYKIYIDSDQDLSELFYSGNPLTEELRQQVLAIDGVEAVITARQSAGADFQAGSYSGGGMGDMITPENYPAIENALTEGSMPPDSHSILAAKAYKELKAGTTLQLTLGGKTATVTVSGLFDLSKLTVGYGHGDLQLDGAMLFLPKELFEELLPEADNYQYAWDIVSDPSKDAAVRMGLLEIADTHTGIALDAFSDQVAYHQSSYSVPFHIMQGISLFISLFGVINLINTTLSNQMARKQEVSILRSIGMTKKQLYQMITVEGIVCVMSSIFLTILAGFPIAYTLHRQFSKTAYGTPTPFQFPFLFMALYFLLLVTVEFILSTWTIRNQEKHSFIEQLRAID